MIYFPFTCKNLRTTLKSEKPSKTVDILSKIQNYLNCFSKKKQ